MALWDTLKDHLVPAVATAAVLGTGASVIGDKVDLARHDERIARIEKLDQKMDELTKELADTRVTIAGLKKQ